MDTTTFLHGTHLSTLGVSNPVSTSGYELDEEKKFVEIISSFPRYLVKFYNSMMEECSEKEVTISPCKGRVFYASKTVMREPVEQSQLHLQDLPVNLQLLVFSYLDAKTLSVLACTCKYWRILSEDSVLWMSRIKHDLFHWKTITHLTHPETYLEASADITHKEIYRKCCPELQKYTEKNKRRFQLFPFSFSFWTLQKTPTVVMFGPGLESDTSGIVKALLWAENSPFKVAGMSPGLEAGFGSGMCLHMGDTHFNLIILYSSTKKEREDSAKSGKQRSSKLLAQDREADDGEDNTTSNELTYHMRELCKKSDAFVYVVDSSDKGEKVNLGDKELQAMMDKRWTQTKAPLLVLSCTVNSSVPSVSCASVVRLLNLRLLTRPWKVTEESVETLNGISSGMTWLLRNAQSSI